MKCFAFLEASFPDTKRYFARIFLTSYCHSLSIKDTSISLISGGTVLEGG